MYLVANLPKVAARSSQILDEASDLDDEEIQKIREEFVMAVDFKNEEVFTIAMQAFDIVIYLLSVIKSIYRA